MTRRAMFLSIPGLVLASARLNAGPTPDAPGGRALPVSLIRIIARPSDYDRQRVRIIGYLDYNGVDLSLGVYLSEVDGRDGVIPNSVDIRIDPRKVKPLIRSYVIFNGTYHAPVAGAPYNGYFDEILDLKLWNVGR